MFAQDIPTFDDRAKARLIDYLATHDLARGVGTEESACSIAAINLAISGELTDKIPECCSLVIGRWVIATQDAMPSAIRNSTRWKNALVLLAGSGREYEQQRIAVILNWMWRQLECVLPIAEQYKFATEWQNMLTQKSNTAADAAARAARAAADAAARAARAAADAAARAAAADAAAARAAAADAAARAARAAADAAADAAAYAAAADAAAYTAAYAAAYDNFWQQADPCGLLEKLLEIENA